MKYGVMLYLWMHVISYWDDRGNMIGRWCTMGSKILIGVQIILAPMKPDGIKKPANFDGQVFLTGSQVEHVLLKNEDVFVLFAKEEYEQLGEFLEPVQPI